MIVDMLTGDTEMGGKHHRPDFRDQLLGGAGLGDIGQHFPDTAAEWAGADSITLLAHVVSLIDDEGWSVANIDCAVVCERPKLAPHRDEMQSRLTAVVGAPVTIKGNRAERLGAIGRTEGIACFATALLVREHPEAERRHVGRPEIRNENTR